MYTEGLMLSYMLETTEGRYVSTADIPGDFIQTDYDKVETNTKIEG